MAASYGIVGGYQDGTFRPDNTATRGQFSQMLVRTRGWQPVTSGQHFTDVPVGGPFHDEIEALVAQPFNPPIISGYACGGVNPESGTAEPCDASNRPYFRYNNKVKRTQMIKMISVAYSSAPSVGCWR